MNAGSLTVHARNGGNSEHPTTGDDEYCNTLPGLLWLPVGSRYLALPAVIISNLGAMKRHLSNGYYRILRIEFFA